MSLVAKNMESRLDCNIQLLEVVCYVTMQTYQSICSTIFGVTGLFCLCCLFWLVNEFIA